MPKTQSFLWNMAATNAHLTVKNNLVMKINKKNATIL